MFEPLKFLYTLGEGEGKVIQIANRSDPEISDLDENNPFQFGGVHEVIFTQNNNNKKHLNLNKIS